MDRARHHDAEVAASLRPRPQRMIDGRLPDSRPRDAARIARGRSVMTRQGLFMSPAHEGSTSADVNEEAEAAQPAEALRRYEAGVPAGSLEVLVDGVRLAVAREGKGPPVICL